MTKREPADCPCTRATPCGPDCSCAERLRELVRTALPFVRAHACRDDWAMAWLKDAGEELEASP